MSRCNAQFVSENGHVRQSGQSELRVRDFPVDQKGGASLFIEVLCGNARVSSRVMSGF